MDDATIIKALRACGKRKIGCGGCPFSGPSSHECRALLGEAADRIESLSLGVADEGGGSDKPKKQIDRQKVKVLLGMLMDVVTDELEGEVRTNDD